MTLIPFLDIFFKNVIIHLYNMNYKGIIFSD